VTFAAWRPFGPSTTSNSTAAPSCRERKPRAVIALKCTKTSSPELVGMKPKPFASLNHLTVPLLRILNLSFFFVRASLREFHKLCIRDKPVTAPATNSPDGPGIPSKRQPVHAPPEEVVRPAGDDADGRVVRPRLVHGHDAPARDVHAVGRQLEADDARRRGSV